MLANPCPLQLGVVEARKLKNMFMCIVHQNGSLIGMMAKNRDGKYCTIHNVRSNVSGAPACERNNKRKKPNESSHELLKLFVEKSYMCTPLFPFNSSWKRLWKRALSSPNMMWPNSFPFSPNRVVSIALRYREPKLVVPGPPPCAHPIPTFSSR